MASEEAPQPPPFTSSAELQAVRGIAERHIAGWPQRVSRDMRGDIERALLEALRTERNTVCRRHFKRNPV